jgi:hypothetical protein
MEARWAMGEHAEIPTQERAEENWGRHKMDPPPRRKRWALPEIKQPEVESSGPKTRAVMMGYGMGMGWDRDGLVDGETPGLS